MNIFGRHDGMLLAGLAVAMFVVFAGQVNRLLDFAREVERNYGVALMPALVILTVVFVFQQQSKRQEAKSKAAEAQVEARQAEMRAAEMERLVAFGEALGRSLDTDAIRDVAAQHLHRLAGSENAWAMIRVGDGWQALMSTARETRTELERSHEAVATLVMNVHQADSTLGPRSTQGHYCVPMTAGGDIVGIVGSPEPDALGESRQRMLAMSAALLGISVRNAQLFQKVQESSYRDGLTGCYNRTHTVEVVETELKRARRSRAPLSLMMFDIDHFKTFNDQYGHLGGDAVLMAVGKHLRERLRGSDVKCRYGGEEFLVLLPETPLENARGVAETLRRELEEMRVPYRGEELAITASFGVACAMPLEADPQAIIGRADAALYRAKEQGRNCVRLAAAESAVA